MKTVAHALTLTLSMAAMSPTAAQTPPDRTQRPALAGDLTVRLPRIQKGTLANGLAVWVVEDHELPTAVFNLVIRSGSERDPAGNAGTASLTADLLDEGTSARSALAIADELEFIGATLSVNSDMDASSVTLSSLTKHLDKALAVFADVVSDPSFPAGEFDRLKKQRLTTLLTQKDQPGAMATNAYNRILYGETHPYGHSVLGSSGSVTALTRDDCAGFYATSYRPNNALLIVVGDVTLAGVKAKLEPLLSGWKSGTVPPAPSTPAPSTPKRMVYLVDKPGAAQSEIRIGAPGMARSSPDFFAAGVMNRILGGQFASRLNLNIREEKGYSYGVRSGFTMMRGGGPFTASGSVVTAKTDSALKEFFYEMDRMHAEGITPAELDFALKGISGSFALGFETPSQVATSLRTVYLYGLPEEYYRTYLANFTRVTLDDVKAMAKKYLDTASMVAVVVGDVKTIRPGIEAMKFAEVVVVDAEGKRVE